MVTSKPEPNQRIVPLLITILILGAVIYRVSAQSYSYEIQSIPLKGDFIDFSGLCFMQDNDGFMWFGSTEGLYRYQGTSVKVYRHLIEQRNELRKHFEKEFLLSCDENHDASPRLSKIREIVKMIEPHLHDPDFQLDKMASLMNMSRRAVFRKINAIAGITPHELVRLMRMKKAAFLLRKGELNITEVMYHIGMNSMSNFALSFRRYYGINPGEYRSRESV